MITSPEFFKRQIIDNQLMIVGKVESSKLELIIINGEFYRPGEKMPKIVEKEDQMIMATGIYSGKIKIEEVIKRGENKTIVKDKVLKITWSEFIDPKTQKVIRSMCPHISYYAQPKSCVMAINYRQLGWSLSHDYSISQKANFLKAKETLVKERQVEQKQEAKN